MMERSVSEPLLISAEPRLSVEAVHTRSSFIVGLLQRFELFTLEQESAARRIQDLRNLLRRSRLLSGCYNLPSTLLRDTALAATSALPVPSAKWSADPGHGDADALRQRNRQILELLNENDRLRLQLVTARSDCGSRCVDNHSAELEAERKLRLDCEKDAAKATDILVQQNLLLTEANNALEAELKDVRADAETWKSRAQNVQDMQEVAIMAFEKCNALEAENAELKQAMDTFAEGSTSVTVQQLQKIITNLAEEVSQYKKRDSDLKVKENMLRDKENNSIIRAMRKQTRELKRRSLQARNTDSISRESKSNATVTAQQVSTAKDSALPAIPSFSELFLM